MVRQIYECSWTVVQTDTSRPRPRPGDQDQEQERKKIGLERSRDQDHGLGDYKTGEYHLHVTHFSR